MITEDRISNQREFTGRNNDLAPRYADQSNDISRSTGDRMADLSMRQARESSGAAYAGADTAIKGQAEAKGLYDQATGKEYGGRMDAAAISRDAAINQAKLQALASVVSAVGNRVAREIEDGFELRY